MKTAILEKDGLTATIGYRACADRCGRFMLITHDPRMPAPAVSQQDDEATAERNFAGSVAKSTRRGWRVVYAGEVNRR